MQVHEKSPHIGLASNLSIYSSLEIWKTVLVVDSGSTDHMLTDKTWFKNYQILDTTVNNPNGGKTKVNGTGDVDVEARDTKSVLYKLTFAKQRTWQILTSRNFMFNENILFGL